MMRFGTYVWENGESIGRGGGGVGGWGGVVGMCVGGFDGVR